MSRTAHICNDPSITGLFNTDKGLGGEQCSLMGAFIF